VLPEGNEPRTVRRCSAICAERGIARFVFLVPGGGASRFLVSRIRVAPGCDILDPLSFAQLRGAMWAEMRKHKGLSPQPPRFPEDNVRGSADDARAARSMGLFSGRSTRPQYDSTRAVKRIKNKPSAQGRFRDFLHVLPEQSAGLRCCAVISRSGLAPLADSAIQRASLRSFGIACRSAMISTRPDIGLGRASTRCARHPHCASVAPRSRARLAVQYDAAAIRCRGQQSPRTPRCRHATVFIFPDLNTGHTNVQGRATHRE